MNRHLCIYGFKLDNVSYSHFTIKCAKYKFTPKYSIIKDTFSQFKLQLINWTDIIIAFYYNAYTCYINLTSKHVYLAINRKNLITVLQDTITLQDISINKVDNLYQIIFKGELYFEFNDNYVNINKITIHIIRESNKLAYLYYKFPTINLYTYNNKQVIYLDKHKVVTLSDNKLIIRHSYLLPRQDLITNLVIQPNILTFHIHNNTKQKTVSIFFKIVANHALLNRISYGNDIYGQCNNYDVIKQKYFTMKWFCGLDDINRFIKECEWKINKVLTNLNLIKLYA